MTSTLPPDPPNFPGINYNPSFWSNATTTGLTYNQALKNFLAFPVAQGTESLQNTSVNGTLTLVNPITPSETYSQYIDQNPVYDMTLSTTQNNGGLTIRTPTNSFTMNPKTFNINLVTPSPVTGAQFLNPIDMNNFNIVNMGQYSTAYTQANNTNLDYVATCNYVNNMIVNGNGILDNNNVWTGTNEFQNSLSVTYNGGLNIGQYGNLSNSTILNPQIFVIKNSNQNDSAQIYFQMFNSAGVAQTPMNFTPTAVYCNLPLNLTNGSDINMGNNDINNCTSINPPSGNYITTTTPPNGDNSTKIATTSWVNNNLPALTNYAQLNTGNAQTFTGANNFTGLLLKSGFNVATVPNLQYAIDTYADNYILGTVDHITFNSGNNQKTIYNPSSNTGSFYSFPFVITVNNYVASGDILCFIQFSVNPLPNWPPAITTGQLAGTSSGMVNYFGYTWGGLPNGKAGLTLTMAYNVGTGSIVTFNLASLGLIQS